MLRLQRPICRELMTVRNGKALFERCHARTFVSGHILGKKQMPPRPAPIDEAEFTEVFLCGSGPGGQKINKTSSAVQLKHMATGIVLKVQETRSRQQNRKIAREKLALRVEEMAKGAQSRTAVVAAVKRQRKSSAGKKSRRKYKALEAAKAAAAAAAAAGGDGGGQHAGGLQGSAPAK